MAAADFAGAFSEPTFSVVDLLAGASAGGPAGRPAARRRGFASGVMSFPDMKVVSYRAKPMP